MTIHHKFRRAIVALALLVALGGAACGSSDQTGSKDETTETTEAPADDGAISRADLGEKWPLTVESGTLACDGVAEGAGDVTFTSEGTTYALNGLAKGRAARNGWAEIDPIWADDPDVPGLKVNIGPLIDRGLALCHG